MSRNPENLVDAEAEMDDEEEEHSYADSDDDDEPRSRRRQRMEDSSDDEEDDDDEEEARKVCLISISSFRARAWIVIQELVVNRTGTNYRSGMVSSSTKTKRKTRETRITKGPGGVRRNASVGPYRARKTMNSTKRIWISSANRIRNGPKSPRR